MRHSSALVKLIPMTFLKAGWPDLSIPHQGARTHTRTLQRRKTGGGGWFAYEEASLVSLALLLTAGCCHDTQRQKEMGGWVGGSWGAHWSWRGWEPVGPGITHVSPCTKCDLRPAHSTWAPHSLSLSRPVLLCVKGENYPDLTTLVQSSLKWAIK